MGGKLQYENYKIHSYNSLIEGSIAYFTESNVSLLQEVVFFIFL